MSICQQFVKHTLIALRCGRRSSLQAPLAFALAKEIGQRQVTVNVVFPEIVIVKPWVHRLSDKPKKSAE